ncbi:MAG: hypothetical protein FWH55_11870, partial [Oscillospiraceae bacterium]|nr:hypothetical protein [Oscillospiraceae bacterium]
MNDQEPKRSYLWSCLPVEVTKPYEAYRHDHGGVMRGIPPICTNLVLILFTRYVTIGKNDMEVC